MSDESDVSYESDSSSIWTSYGETSEDDDNLLQSQLELIQEQIQTHSDSDRELYFNTSTNNGHNETILDADTNLDQVQTPDKPVVLRESANYPIIISDQSGDEEIESELESFEKDESDSEMSRGRARLKSHDSINSNPKSWVDFEEENRSWRPMRFKSQSRPMPSSICQSSKISSDTRISFESSEGYKSDSLKSTSSTSEKQKKRLSRRNSAKKERCAPATEVVDTTLIRERKSSIQSLSDASSNDHFPLRIKDIIQIRIDPDFQTYQNSKNMTLSSPAASTVDEFSEAESIAKTRIVAKIQKDKVASEAVSKTRDKLPKTNYTYKRIPDRITRDDDFKDTLARRFDQNQKSTMSGIEGIYSRHGQRTSQLLMDLHIQMTKSGYGQYRPKLDA